MKPETEKVMRSILAGDPSVDEPTVNAAVDILHQRCLDPTRGLVRVLRIKEVAKLLGVVRETVHVYAANGLLEKVMGNGVVPLGISLDSYVRFTEVRSRQISAERDARRPRKPERLGPPKRVLERESLLRKATWALRGYRQSSHHEKYTAIREYLHAHKGLPNTIACEALGTTATAYYHYWRLRPKTEARNKAKREAILKAVRLLHPDKRKRVFIRHLVVALKARHITVYFDSLKRILSEEHYNLKPHVCHHHHPEPQADESSWYHAEDFVECS